MARNPSSQVITSKHSSQSLLLLMHVYVQQQPAVGVRTRAHIYIPIYMPAAAATRLTPSLSHARPRCSLLSSPGAVAPVWVSLFKAALLLFSRPGPPLLHRFSSAPREQPASRLHSRFLGDSPYVMLLSLSLAAAAARGVQLFHSRSRLVEAARSLSLALAL